MDVEVSHMKNEYLVNRPVNYLESEPLGHISYGVHGEGVQVRVGRNAAETFSTIIVRKMTQNCQMVRNSVHFHKMSVISKSTNLPGHTLRILF